MLALFVVRVVAQPLALVVRASFLPPFESWHSGVLPYEVLAGTQLAIVVWQARTAQRFMTGRVQPRARLGALMLTLGGAYFVAMLLRLLLGATVFSDRRWFASPVPTVFHLILATYLLLYGHFHFHYGGDAVDPKLNAKLWE
jgi:hypothetical protein